MKTDELIIINRHGLKLAANLDSPSEGKPKAYAVFAHCFTCSKELKSIANINSSLAEFGIATLRFDMTGIGSSEGSFSDTNFTTQIEDLLDAAGYLNENYWAPSLLIGHSLGGAVSLCSLPQIESVKAVVTIASPAEPAYLANKLRNTKNRANLEGLAETEIGGVKFKFKPGFFTDIESYSLKPIQKKIETPYLIMHSPADTYSDLSNAEELFAHANQPKSFISLDDIDHLMLKKEDAVYVGKLIGTWSEKYI
jgi:alpha-beta hydrolase superfamily lysophospholipase